MRPCIQCKVDWEPWSRHPGGSAEQLSQSALSQLYHWINWVMATGGYTAPVHECSWTRTVEALMCLPLVHQALGQALLTQTVDGWETMSSGNKSFAFCWTSALCKQSARSCWQLHEFLAGTRREAQLAGLKFSIHTWRNTKTQEQSGEVEEQHSTVSLSPGMKFIVKWKILPIFHLF